MSNELITASFVDNKYYGTIHSWNKEYHELEKYKVNYYYNNIDNTNIITELQNNITNLDNQILELIKQRKLKELELNFINDAEQVKKKNKEITDHINNLKRDNKLNKWYTVERWSDTIDEIIENGTYKMLIRTTVQTSKGNIKGFKVSYWFEINPMVKAKTIQVIHDKHFNTDAEVEKYINGRKKAFQKYFTEEKPAILKEYKDCIYCNGILLDGYKIEE